MTNDKTPTKLHSQLDILSVRLSLLAKKERTGLSWRKLGERMGINGATLHTIATTDYEPRDNAIRAKLGMSTSYRLQIIKGDGDGVDDMQTLGCKWCKCGNAFISNAGNRRYCFTCSPPKSS